MEVEQVEAALRAGDFSVKPRLKELLLATADTSNARAPRLWAHVATHAEVSALAEVSGSLTRPELVRQVVVSLGLPLSPAALPLLWRIRDDFDDAELDPYVALALHTILGRSEGGDEELADERISLEAAAASLDPRQYHYRGKPVFPGEMTKELVVAATAARHEKKKFSLGNPA